MGMRVNTSLVLAVTATIAVHAVPRTAHAQELNCGDDLDVASVSVDYIDATGGAYGVLQAYDDGDDLLARVTVMHNTNGSVQLSGSFLLSSGWKTGTYSVSPTGSRTYASTNLSQAQFTALAGELSRDYPLTSVQQTQEGWFACGLVIIASAAACGGTAGLGCAAGVVASECICLDAYGSDLCGDVF